MIVLKKGIESNIRLTLSEMQTIVATKYRLVFISRQTKETVLINDLTDISLYPIRINRFLINTGFYFTGFAEGLWDYKAYAYNDTQTELLEIGAMKLLAAAEFEYTSHTPESNTFKAYQG